MNVVVVVLAVFSKLIRYRRYMGKFDSCAARISNIYRPLCVFTNVCLTSSLVSQTFPFDSLTEPVSRTVCEFFVVVVCLLVYIRLFVVFDDGDVVVCSWGSALVFFLCIDASGFKAGLAEAFANPIVALRFRIGH